MWLDARPRLRTLLLFLFFLTLTSAPATSSGPLPGAPAGRPAETARADEAPGLWTRLLFAINREQQRLRHELTGTVREIRSSGSAQAVLALLAIAFLYGVFHAVGPGHGKVVISSYLLAREDRARRGVQLAVLSSFVQALSAIALVGLFALLLGLPNLETSAKTQVLEIASYGLIILLGLWMLVSALRGGTACAHDHAHGPMGGHGQVRGPDQRRTSRLPLRQLAAVVLAVGIRPCSGAVIILLFTLAQGMLAAGVGATFAMAAGTAITVSALGVLTVASKQAALRWVSHGSPWERRLQRGLAITGSCAITAFGVLFLLAAIEQPALV